jgi:hypothetical protein
MCKHRIMLADWLEGRLRHSPDSATPGRGCEKGRDPLRQPESSPYWRPSQTLQPAKPPPGGTAGGAVNDIDRSAYSKSNRVTATTAPLNKADFVRLRDIDVPQGTQAKLRGGPLHWVRLQSC